MAQTRCCLDRGVPPLAKTGFDGRDILHAVRLNGSPTRHQKKAKIRRITAVAQCVSNRVHLPAALDSLGEVARAQAKTDGRQVLARRRARLSAPRASR
jgi:hypothetical protein